MVVVMLLGSVGTAPPIAAQATVAVPNVVGLPEADAVAAITAAGLTPGTRGSAYDLAVPLGIILSSDPVAGTLVDPAITPIAYVVSAGPPPQTMQPTPPPTPKPLPTPKPTKPPKPPGPPTPRPTPWPTPPGVKGIDVSHWNGAPDFGALRAQGMNFVFSKASQGVTIEDATFQRNTQAARAAGLKAGAYHFFDYNVGGVEQAAYFLAAIGKTTGLDGLLPLVVDVETLKSLGTPDPPVARARLHDMLDELYRQTGRYPMIYTSREMWKRVVGEPDDFGGYPLWVACWKCDTIHLPRGWSGWRFWQAGQFDFQDGVKLDGNAYASSQSKLKREVQRAMRLEGGAEWSTTEAADADLRGFSAADVRVGLDGGQFGAWAPFKKNFQLQLGGQQGLRTVQLQLRSFRGVTSPTISDDIQLDSVPPNIKGPKISLGSGVRLSPSGERVPVTAGIDAFDKTSGLAWSRLESGCGGPKAAQRARPAASADLVASIRRSGCTLNGTAGDVAGNVGTRGFTPQVALVDVKTRSGRLSTRGNWRTEKTRGALGRTLARASAKGAQAKLSFTGAQFAVVARRGPSGGHLDVIVDGKRAGTVSLYSNKADNRRVVHVGDVSPGKHVVSLRATGTADEPSTGTSVWIDAVLVLDRRK
jgi:GH25 family lysozyme M1 (1,4-beta-N-acetylmuramidase)